MALKLGRLLEHDPRSLDYPAATGTVVSKTWRHYGAALDQGQTSSCTGNAMAQAVNTQPVHVPRHRLLSERDALTLYGAATVLDGFPGTYPPDDSGSSGLAVAKAAQQAGFITGYTHAFGLDHALGALQVGPCLAGTSWYEGMFNPDAAGFVTPSGSVAGGHEYLLYGVNVTGKYVLALNSWGPGWGVKGRFRLTFDVLSRLLDEQGDITCPTR